MVLILKSILEGFDVQIREVFPYRKAHEFPGNYFGLKEQILQIKNQLRKELKGMSVSAALGPFLFTL